MGQAALAHACSVKKSEEALLFLLLEDRKAGDTSTGLFHSQGVSEAPRCLQAATNVILNSVQKEEPHTFCFLQHDPLTKAQQENNLRAAACDREDVPGRTQKGNRKRDQLPPVLSLATDH